jgi:uncharacterized protein (TIGR03067 family)
MKSPMLAIFMATTLLPLASAADRRKAPAGDLGRLQGRWCAKAGPRRDIDVTLEVDGRQVRIGITTADGLSFQVSGELRVDERATPRALDWIHFRDSDSQELPDVLAIYEFAGERLRVCNGGPNNARPSEFKAGDGVLADLLTFERAKPEARPRATEP